MVGSYYRLLNLHSVVFRIYIRP